MKRINIFYLHQKPTLKFLNSLKKTKFVNNIHSKDNDFLCEYFDFEENKFNIAEIRLIDLFESENIDQNLKKFTFYVINNTSKWSKENMDEANETNVNKIFSCISSSLIKAEYSDDDIFDFVVNVFFKINVTHKLSNGNKRVATTMLTKLLYLFGYRITFEYDKTYNCLYFEDECLKIIEQSSNHVSEDQIIKQIKDWILSNISLACNVID